MNGKYAYEMIVESYKELAQKVYANLDGQGCFDEMKETIEMVVEELKGERAERNEIYVR